MTSPLLEEPTQEPARIGRYTLLSLLGRGGSAQVYLAELSGQGGFRRLVAIKRIHRYLRGEAEFVNMFLDEARIAGSIRHPNVVGIHEVHADEDDCYFVMDYVDGMTLADMIAAAEARNAMLPFGASVTILLDVLAGLHCAHDLRGPDGLPLNVVHRDVSPANILVGLDGTARLVDFGIARATTRLTYTQPGIVKGRFTYMAPEQGLQDSVDRRADVYSAGAVLWELLAGSRLGTRETLSPSALLREVPDVRERNPQVPAMIAGVCARALEVSLGERWASAEKFAHNLEVAARVEVQIASRAEVAQLVANLRGTLHESGARRKAGQAARVAGPPRNVEGPTKVLPQMLPASAGREVSSGGESPTQRMARWNGTTGADVYVAILAAWRAFLAWAASRWRAGAERLRELLERG